MIDLGLHSGTEKQNNSNQWLFADSGTPYVASQFAKGTVHHTGFLIDTVDSTRSSEPFDVVNTLLHEHPSIINFNNVISPTTIDTDINRPIYYSRYRKINGKHIYIYFQKNIPRITMSEASQQVSICEVFLNDSQTTKVVSLETRHRCQSPASVLGCRNGRTATPSGCPCGPNGLRTTSRRASDRCPEILRRSKLILGVDIREYMEMWSETFTWYQILEAYSPDIRYQTLSDHIKSFFKGNFLKKTPFSQSKPARHPQKTMGNSSHVQQPS